MLRSIGNQIVSLLSKSKFQQVHRDGTIEFAVGIVIAVFAYDRYIQNSTQERSIALHQEKTRFLQHVVQVEQAKKKDEPIISNGDSMEQKLTRDQLLSQINSLDSDTARSDMALKYKGRPALFQCAVKRIPPMFDGHYSLVGVKVNDIVDILEENVGPDKLYNLCRPVKTVDEPLTVGWFPKNCLERIENDVINDGSTKIKSKHE